MIPVTFYNSTQLIDLDTLNRLHEDGVIDRVRLDGKDFFVSADVAMDLRNDGIIELDEKYHQDGFAKASTSGGCGRGWEGSKGNCVRSKEVDGDQPKPKGSRFSNAFKSENVRLAAKTALKVGVGVGGLALAYQMNKSKSSGRSGKPEEPAKSPSLRSLNSVQSGGGRVQRSAQVEKDIARISKRKGAFERLAKIAKGSTNKDTYISARSGGGKGGGKGSMSETVVIPKGVSVKEGRKGQRLPPNSTKYAWRK